MGILYGMIGSGEMWNMSAQKNLQLQEAVSIISARMQSRGKSMLHFLWLSKGSLKWLLTRTTGQTFCQSSIWMKRASNYFQHGCLTRKPINDAKQPYKEKHVKYIKLCVQNSWSCILSKYCLTSYGNIYSDPLRANGVSYMFCTLVFLDNNNHWFALVQFCLHTHAYSNQK